MEDLKFKMKQNDWILINLNIQIKIISYMYRYIEIDLINLPWSQNKSQLKTFICRPITNVIFL